MAKESDNLKLQKQIAEAIKNSTASLSDFADAQKRIGDNWKLIKELTVEIAKANDEMADADKDRREELKQQIESLEQQKKFFQGVNGELGKSKNLLKATGKEALGWAKTMGGQLLPSFKDILDKGYEFDGAVRSVAANLGLSNNRFTQLNNTMGVLDDKAERWGINQADLVNAAGTYSEELGRQVMLSERGYESMIGVAAVTKMSIGEVSQLVGEMEAFGLGAVSASETILSIRDMSEVMGVNSNKVIKKVQQNLSLINKLSFKGGIKGMAKMAAFSEKYKLNMEDVAGFSEKVFRPEGAIEAAAQLQVLGGSLTSLGDPFELMYKARYAPEELAKSLSKAAAESATFNKQTGEFEVNALELDRMREASQATGISMEKLVETAKQTAKIDAMEGMLPKGKDIDGVKDYITSLAEFGEGGQAQISFFDPKTGDTLVKDLSKLSTNDIELIKKQKDSIKDREKLAEQAMTLQEEWKALQNQLMVIASQFLLPIINTLKPMLEGVAKWLTDLGGVAKSLLGGFLVGAALFGKGLMWYMNGVWLRKGFNSGGSKGDVTEMVTSKKGKEYPADSPQGRMIKNMGGKGGVPTTGQTPDGKNISNLSKSFSGAAGDALKMIAFAGAIYVLAQALVVFNDVNWDSLVKGGIAIVGFGLSLKLATPLLEGFSKTAWQSAIPMLALGASLMMLSLSLKMMSTIPLDTLIVSLIGITGVLLAFSLLSPVLSVGSLVLLAFGAAMLMVGGAVLVASYGISMIVDSFTNMFSVINSDNIGALMLLGPALIMTSIGIMALGGSLVFLAASMAMGGFLGLMALTATAETLQSAFGSIDSSNIDKSINSINNVDMDKINALKELSTMMSIWGMFGAKPIEIKLSVDGDIDLKGEGGGKKSTDWVNDPIFVSKLKNIIWTELSKGKNGGKP